MSLYTAVDRSRLFGALVVFLAVLFMLRDPLMPAAGLDPSWLMAMEFVTRNGAAAGRDYVFAYGPYHFLATRLFDPANFALVLFYDAFAVIAVLWVALANRSVLALGAAALCLVALDVQQDALTLLAFFGVFLACLRRPGPWSVLLVALCGPLTIAKLSFGPFILALVLLADAQRAADRRLPLFTPVLLIAALAAYLAAGQQLADIPQFVDASLEVIGGYGRAMQYPGSPQERLASVALAGLSVAVSAALAAALWRRTTERGDRLAIAAGVLGFCWVMFAAFKMGFVRQDLHSLSFHLAAPTAFALLFGFLDRPDGGLGARSKAGFVLAFLAMLAASFFWRAYALRPAPTAPVALGASAAQAVGNLGPRLQQGLGWATGSRWSAAVQSRTAALEALKRPFPPIVVGRVDAAPYEVSSLIASGLDYSPRPVLQSYSAYTPRLQALDLDHFRSARAPDTLFLKIEDIDQRLPTLALGPSLPVIGARYDLAGSDPLGLILRRRETPRPMSRRALGSAPFAPDQWVALPSAQGLLMAKIQMPPSLAGRIGGLLYREPISTITLRTQSGREVRFRFVPGMAELGVALSPLPTAWEESALMLLDPTWGRLAEPVTAFRISHDRPWAFGPASVAFEEVRLAPGFGGSPDRLTVLATDLILSDRQRAATFSKGEIFAHAPAILSARTERPTRLRGVAGLRPQPPGTPRGDGVRFTISRGEGAAAATLFAATVRPGDPPAPFDVAAPAGATLRLETQPLASTDYDWSYWGKLETPSEPTSR